MPQCVLSTYPRWFIWSVCGDEGESRTVRESRTMPLLEGFSELNIRILFFQYFQILRN